MRATLRDQLSEACRPEQLAERVGGLRSREVVALATVAVERLQLAELLLALEALGGRRQPEAVGEPDDRRGSGGGLSRPAEAGDERGVDLDRVEAGQALEAAERGDGDAEVVDQEPDPQRLEVGDGTEGRGPAIHHGPLGDLETE